jgi:hypothetical protein
MAFTEKTKHVALLVNIGEMYGINYLEDIFNDALCKVNSLLAQTGSDFLDTLFYPAVGHR